MRIGLDYRPVSAAPLSGIARQVLALEETLQAHTGIHLLRASGAPLDHPQRATAACPAWADPLDGLQRPQVRWRFEARFLPAWLRQEQIQLYIATANMGLPIGRKPAGTRYVLLLHDLFQLTEHNHHGSRLKALAYRLIDTLSIAWSSWIADRIWCPSQFTAQQAARLFPWARHKLRVLPNRVKGFSDACGTLPANLPARYWLAVGTREPRKNMRRFVRLWQQARQQSAAVPALVLLGQPDDLPSELRQLPGLHWLHGLTDPSLHALYQQAERLWQPSSAEGFGLPVVEALSVSTPVAVARGSALDEVAPPDAPRFQADDDADMLSCLLRLALGPAADVDPATLRRWAERFNQPAYALVLDQLLSELMP